MKIKIEEEQPYTLCVEFRNPRLSALMKPEHIIREIDEALQKNGAKRDIDYSLVVD